LPEDNVVSQDFIHPNAAAIHATPDPLKMSQRSTRSNRHLTHNFNQNIYKKIFLALIKCFCDHCDKTNHICETEGYCYLSWQQNGNSYDYSQR